MMFVIIEMIIMILIFIDIDQGLQTSQLITKKIVWPALWL